MDLTKALPTNIMTASNATQDLTMDLTGILPLNLISQRTTPSEAPMDRAHQETPTPTRRASLSCVSEEEDISLGMDSTMEFTKTFSSFPDTNPTMEFTETLPNTISFRRRSSLGRRQSYERVRTSIGGRVPSRNEDADTTMDLTAALSSHIKLFQTSTPDKTQFEDDMTMDITGTLTSNIKLFSTPKKQQPLDEPMDEDENPELFETTADFTAALAGIFSDDQVHTGDIDPNSYRDQFDLLKEMASVCCLFAWHCSNISRNTLKNSRRM